MKGQQEIDRIRRRAEMVPSDEEQESTDDEKEESHDTDDEEEESLEEGNEMSRIRRRAEMVPSDEEELGSEEGQTQQLKFNRDGADVEKAYEDSSEEDKEGTEDDMQSSASLEGQSDDYYSEDDGNQTSKDDFNVAQETADEVDVQSLTMEERLRRVREGALYVQSQPAKEKKMSGKVQKFKKESQPIKRANKNRPVEMSSKVPVSRYREVVPLGSKKNKARDPRFEAMSGKLNYDLFRKTYDFLDGYQDSEIKELQASLLKETKKRGKSGQRHKELQSVLSRLQQERSSRHRSDKVRKILSGKKKEEREKVAKGKKPFFMKGSEKKKIEMEQRFIELKEKGKLKKYMEKKRKRNAAKDHRWLPAKRTKKV